MTTKRNLISISIFSLMGLAAHGVTVSVDFLDGTWPNLPVGGSGSANRGVVSSALDGFTITSNNGNLASGGTLGAAAFGGPGNLNSFAQTEAGVESLTFSLGTNAGLNYAEADLGSSISNYTFVGIAQIEINGMNVMNGNPTPSMSISGFSADPGASVDVGTVVYNAGIVSVTGVAGSTSTVSFSSPLADTLTLTPDMDSRFGLKTFEFEYATIPEPSTYAGIVAGIGFISALYYRRRRK